MKSLRTRLAVGAALLTLLVTALAGIVVTAAIAANERADVDRALVGRATRVASDAEKLVAQPPSPSGDEYGPLLSGSDSLVRLILDARVVAERGQVPKSELAIPARDGFLDVPIGGVTWRSYTETVSGGSGVRIQVLTSLAPVGDRVASNAMLTGLVSIAAMIAAAAGGWFGARFVLRPLSRLRAGAEEARAAHDTGFRLPRVAAPIEVAELSDTLNDMLERLHASSAATRQFTADAGHELRTPLTSLGAYIETLQRNPDLDPETMTRIVGEMTVEHGRLVRLLSGLQALARGDVGALPSTEPVDLVILAADATAAAQERFARTRFVDTTTIAHATTIGWTDGLRLAVDNLLANAALHGRQGGRVEVSVTAALGKVDLTVADDGPGLTATERETLVRRFARGDTDAPGSGLGLALVAQQAELHGGELTLAPVEPHGLAAILRLPVSPA